jgi:hypothetical protein
MQRGTASPWFGASPDLNRFGPTLLSAATTPIISLMFMGATLRYPL